MAMQIIGLEESEFIDRLAEKSYKDRRALLLGAHCKGVIPKSIAWSLIDMLDQIIGSVSESNALLNISYQFQEEIQALIKFEKELNMSMKSRRMTSGEFEQKKGNIGEMNEETFSTLLNLVLFESARRIMENKTVIGTDHIQIKFETTAHGYCDRRDGPTVYGVENTAEFISG